MGEGRERKLAGGEDGLETRNSASKATFKENVMNPYRSLSNESTTCAVEGCGWQERAGDRGYYVEIGHVCSHHAKLYDSSGKRLDEPLQTGIIDSNDRQEQGGAGVGEVGWTGAMEESLGEGEIKDYERGEEERIEEKV